MPARQPRQPHLKEVPRSRAKSAKPKFEISPEPLAQPEAPSATWVYRADPVETPHIEPVAPPPPQPRISSAETSTSSDNPFLMVGEGLFLISLGTMKLAWYAARGLIVAPVRLASRLLT